MTKPFLEQTGADYDMVMDTNLHGALFVSQHAAAAMVPLGRGSVIDVASTAGLRPGGHLSSCCASKTGLIHLTKVMALELDDRPAALPGVMRRTACPPPLGSNARRLSPGGETAPSNRVDSPSLDTP